MPQCGINITMSKGIKKKHKRLDTIEICAGAGGQALGLELAGFDHASLVDELRNYPTKDLVSKGDYRLLCELD